MRVMPLRSADPDFVARRLRLLHQSFAVEHGGPYQALFAQFGIRCAFLQAKSKLVDKLRGDGWRAVFLDHDWAVLAAPR